MAEFNYEWWLVDVKEATGACTLEIKAKSKDHAIKQIEKLVKATNSEKNLGKPWYQRKAPILEVYWDTLTLDRVGYQRLS